MGCSGYSNIWTADHGRQNFVARLYNAKGESHSECFTAKIFSMNNTHLQYDLVL